jgi:hypothetical protein
MAQHGIHHRGVVAAVVDRPMGNARRDAHQYRFVFTQGDAHQPAVLQHHQFKRTAQQNQLVGLAAVAEDRGGLMGGEVGDQGFVAGLGVAEQGVA